jgi:glycosyltransferase involved in cell wall biosynthesis
VDANLFKPGLDGSVVRQRNGIGADEPVILSVGALDLAHYYRRLDLLLEAVSRSAFPDLHLLVVGDGDRMTEFGEIARELGVDPRTHFLGSVPNGELPGIYAAADLLVLPSDRQESFGLVLIEAMACGKPVIASNLPGARTVVSDGQDGLLVEPGDVRDLAAKLRLLLDDAPRRKEMGARGRAKVEARYAWRRVIPQLVELYEQVLEAA